MFVIFVHTFLCITLKLKPPGSNLSFPFFSPDHMICILKQETQLLRLDISKIVMQ